jgi:MOSC domain-containing protein YiiM
MGENLTLAGIDWDQVGPGARLRLGADVLVEATRYTTPCDALYPFFTGQHIARVSQKVNPGWSRVYVRVLQTGLVRIGDRVELVEGLKPELGEPDTVS